jgi:hypothetical protein
MANEITLTGYAALKNGFNSVKRELPAISATQAGTDFCGPIKYALTTGAASAGKGNITSLGWAVLENMEAAGGQAALVSVDGGATWPITIAPGQWNIISLAAAFTITDLQMKTGASTGSLTVTLFEA